MLFLSDGVSFQVLPTDPNESICCTVWVDCNFAAICSVICFAKPLKFFYFETSFIELFKIPPTFNLITNCLICPHSREIIVVYRAFSLAPQVSVIITYGRSTYFQAPFLPNGYIFAYIIIRFALTFRGMFVQRERFQSQQTHPIESHST